MGSWKQSKVLTKKCWALYKGAKYLSAFPVVGFALGIIPLAIFGIPGAIALSKDSPWVGIPLIALALLGMGVAQTVTMGGLTVCANEELHDKPSSVGAGLAAARGRIGSLSAWALISLVVSVLVSLVRGDGSDNNVLVQILRTVAAGALAAAWQVITFFVMPFIMLAGQNPKEAISSSASLVKATWGKQVMGGVRIGGFVFLVAMLPAILVLVAGGFMVSVGNATGVAGIGLIILALLVMLGAGLVVATLKGIFSVVLYNYAANGESLGGFSEAELNSAVQVKAGAAS